MAMAKADLQAESAIKTASRRDLRVLWVSSTYGYGDDMLYYAELLRQFCRCFPAARILTERAACYRDASDLPLDPVISGLVIPHRRRVGGADYDASVRIPWPSYPWRLWRRRPQAVVAIEFTALSLMTLAVASLLPGTARLLLVESDPAARGGGTSWPVLAVKRWACRRADVIQTNTVQGWRFLCERLGVPPQKVRLAPYLTSCPPRPEPLAQDRADRVRLLFVNGLTARKGAAQLLAALALLPDALRRRLSLRIVGDGPERPALEAAARGLGGIAITFSGAQPYRELGTFYAAADVLVIPSLADYRALAGFEGLAYGLALIGSIHDGASAETITHRGTGFAIDPLDPAAFAAAIARLVEDPQLLAGCRARSARLFQSTYSYPRIAANLAESIEAAWTARCGTALAD